MAKYWIRICGALSLAFYTFFGVELWKVCQYGGFHRHKGMLFIGGIGCALTFLIWLILTIANWRRFAKRDFVVGVVLFLLVTIGAAGSILHSGVAFNGRLSWKLEEWRQKREVTLEHSNILESGVEGILTDLNKLQGLPEELYITNQLLIDFDETGEIQEISAFLYGRDDQGEDKTFLVEYNAKAGKKMTVWVNGNASLTYDADMRLHPMLLILQNSNWKEQVAAWSENHRVGTTYELLYLGRRSFLTADGLEYVPGDADGDGVVSGEHDFSRLRTDGGEMLGYEVSLHIPKDESLTPVRYMMEPEYIPVEKLQQENAQEETKAASKMQGWTLDNTDGSMYFMLEDKLGWRMVVTDAALGSRWYALEETRNGGGSWKRINDAPFGDRMGVVNGLFFANENLGFAGITGASQSYGFVYVTTDGGNHWDELTFPMDGSVTLPKEARELGLTWEDYDYVNMPVRTVDGWSVTITTEGSETQGIQFVSADGITWEELPTP